MDPAQIRAIWGREETRFGMETGPLGFQAGVQLGHGSLWTGEGKQAVTTVFRGELAAADTLCLAAGSEDGNTSILARALGNSYCSSFLFLPQGKLSPVEGWEILLGENLGVFGWKEEIWGHSCCLHPSKGVSWTEKQAYCIGLQRAKLDSVGGNDSTAEKSIRFEIKFRIKYFLKMSTGKSLSLRVHIFKRK